jgi:hypothetical protein
MVEQSMREESGFRVRFEQRSPPRPVEERLREACDLASFGRELVAINVRLRNPAVSDDEIRAAVRAWLQSQPTDESAWLRRVSRPGLG